MEEFLSGNNPKLFNTSDKFLSIMIEKNDNDELLQNAVLQIKINSDAMKSLNWKILISEDGRNWSDAQTRIEHTNTVQLENRNVLMSYRIKGNITNERLLFKIETSL